MLSAGSVRRQLWQQSVLRHGDAAPGPVPFAVSCGSSLCPGTATGQRTPGRALCTPRPCASPVRRCAVPSLTPASPGPAAIRSCSPRPFADVLSAHPGTVPSLGGPGWRFPPLIVFFLFLMFFMAEGFVKSFRPHRNAFKKQKEGFAGGESGASRRCRSFFLYDVFSWLADLRLNFRLRHF